MEIAASQTVDVQICRSVSCVGVFVLRNLLLGLAELLFFFCLVLVLFVFYFV